MKFKFFILILTSFLILFNYTEAQEAGFSIHLDEASLERGFTIKDQGLTLGLWPEVLDLKKICPQLCRGVKINIQNLDQEGWKVPKDKNLISDLYTFDFSSPDFSFQSSEEQIFKKPFDLVLKYETENDSAKHIYLYNHQLGKWSEIPTTKIDPKKKTIQIKLKIPYAQIAVLEEKPLFGKASWFPTSLTPRDLLGSACNEYDLGTKVRVTNLKNNKSFITTIISHGPYVKGRIIDLTGRAFSKIANVRQGLVEVKIEKL